MRLKSLINLILMISAMSFFLAPAHAAVQWTEDHTIALIYPTSMTYVDRADPLVDFGSEGYLMVGDERGTSFTEPGDQTTYFNAVNAKRTYLRFSTADINALSGYTITGATLNLQLSNLLDGPGTYTTFDTINVRQVTAADSYDYISGLTWDEQADRGVSFTGGTLFASRDFLVSGESLGWKQWELPSSGGGSIAGMVEGWRDGSIANYGLVMENDFDGKWAEIEDAVKYTIDYPAQMNELVATFSKTTGNYPFLRVTVTPEPASMVLMLVGAGVLRLASRRKKK